MRGSTTQMPFLRIGHTVRTIIYDFLRIIFNMKRKFIALLSTIFFLAALSLTIVQIEQTKQNAEISNNLFNISVNNAMDEVVERLNSLKVEDYISSGYRYKLLQFKRLEDINDRMRTLLRDHSSLFYDEQRIAFGVSLQDSAVIRRGRRLSSADSATINAYNTLIDSRNRILSGSQQSMEYEQHPESILDELMRAETFNYPQLDSLIFETLLVNGVELQPSVAVTSSASEEPLYVSDSTKMEKLKRTPYKYSFHPNLSSNVYYISLYFYSRSPLLRENLHLYTITSLFLIGIILALFTLLLRINSNQNKVDEMKTDFINNMTHEIKTPIATIGLACEMLQDKSIDHTAETSQGYIGIIRSENQRMRMLVETILQSAKMSNKNFTLNRSLIDVKAVIDNVVGSFSMTVANQKGTLSFHCHAMSTLINADELHITNAIYNLVDNAIKYSSGNVHVEIHAYEGPDCLIIKVSDQGMGIDKESQRHIFEKFYRVSTGDVHNVKGFGIGLSYVKQVVDLHGGNITVESEPGKGSTFTIMLPR